MSSRNLKGRAIAVVVPGFDNNPADAPETVEVNGATYKIYKATKNGHTHELHPSYLSSW